MLIKIPKGWEIPEWEATPEHVYMNRRRFLKGLGLSSVWTIGALSGCINLEAEKPKVTPLSTWPLTEKRSGPSILQAAIRPS